MYLFIHTHTHTETRREIDLCTTSIDPKGLSIRFTRIFSFINMILLYEKPRTILHNNRVQSVLLLFRREEIKEEIPSESENCRLLGRSF